MGLGVLDDSVLEHVPGTVNILDDINKPVPTNESHLKHDKTGTIILVPQPSDDPNDPLNWPLWKRDLILFLLSMVAILATTLSPILAADTLSISLYMELSFTKVALLTGWHLFGVGIAGFLFVASARVWGKRHLFLLGNLLMIVTTAWGGASNKNYNSELAARVFQGVALAPFEALVNATVGDLYFVHERGKRMAISNLATYGGSFLTPVFVGKIAHTLGWQWSFYLLTIFSGATFPLVFFCIPETAYRRASYLNTDITADEQAPHETAQTKNEDEPSNGEGSSASIDKEATDEEKAVADSNGSDSNIPQRDSFSKRLRPFNGRKTDESFFKLVVRPFPLFFQPAIFWACLTQASLIGWTVLIGVVLAAIFMGPPLWFDEVKTGYMYTGAFIGAILGFLLSGAMADWTYKIMVKRNHGIYEPEFRIVLVIPQLILGVAGVFGFGITCNDPEKYGWFWPDFFFALVVAGMVIGAVASALYVTDAYREQSIEIFTCLLIFKNMLCFGLTFSAYNWILESGILTPFYWMGGIQAFVCLLSIPMYIFGKKNRSFFHRHDILRILKLK
ncbi:MAG: hypothetical protein M1834_006543 [Cirrosporium novae-zelandiae]|nr:MAG: hypothetical protein M1834_006543 [Cirrosporium novae-zelandiae]